MGEPTKPEASAEPTTEEALVEISAKAKEIQNLFKTDTPSEDIILDESEKIRQLLIKSETSFFSYIQDNFPDTWQILLHEFRKLFNAYSMIFTAIYTTHAPVVEYKNEVDAITIALTEIIDHLITNTGFKKLPYPLSTITPKFGASARVSDKSIQFTKILPKHIPTKKLNVSILRIQLLIFNMIANAERELQKSARKELTFEIEPADTCLLIVIADSGNGQLQANHFQGTTEYAGKGGHGIGLAASLKTVIDANGRIDAISQGKIIHMEDMTDTRSPVITPDVEQKLAGTEIGTAIVVTLPYAA